MATENVSLGEFEPQSERPSGLNSPRNWKNSGDYLGGLYPLGGGGSHGGSSIWPINPGMSMGSGTPSFKIPIPGNTANNPSVINYKEIPCPAFGKGRKSGGLVKKVWNGINFNDQEPHKKRIFIEKGLTYMPTLNKLSGIKNSFGKMTELEHYGALAKKGKPSKRFRFYSNMSGFTDEEISFFVQGRVFIIQGYHRKTEEENERRVSEAISLPRGIRADNFRVARDDDGIVHFEEAWLK